MLSTPCGALVCEREDRFASVFGDGRGRGEPRAPEHSPFVHKLRELFDTLPGLGALTPPESMRYLILGRRQLDVRPVRCGYVRYARDHRHLLECIQRDEGQEWVIDLRGAEGACAYPVRFMLDAEGTLSPVDPLRIESHVLGATLER